MPDSLFILDKNPVDNELINYFNQFNFETISIPSLAQLKMCKEIPLAILIHSDFIKTDVNLIGNLYQQYKVPLIVISDNQDEAICVQTLEEGADDFLQKPVNPRELHARISAIGRRVSRAQQAQLEKDVFHFADWRLYPGSHQIFGQNNEELKLSAGEYALLLTFIKHPQEVLSRDDLLQILKNTDTTSLDRRIDVQISRLRQKIEQDSKKPCLIKTIRNGGYLFTPQVLLKTEKSSS